jgi:single-strand DNA-binding protein
MIMEALLQMTGYVGGDVNLRATASSVPVADFRLACTPRILRSNQWVDADTTWITVKAFRGLAENVAASVRRGDPVIVLGRLRTSTWVKDEQTYERLELEAASVGHDLNRGRTTFHRKTVVSGEAEEAGAPRSPEVPEPEEAMAGSGVPW